MTVGGDGVTEVAVGGKSDDVGPRIAADYACLSCAKDELFGSCGVEVGRERRGGWQ